MSTDSVNKALARMRKAGKVMDVRAKGEAGEAAAFDIVHEYRSKRGGILKQGFMYPYASNRQSQIYLGNIFWDAAKGQYYDMTKQLNDEIDILYISHYRIFPIEVKSYHDDNIVVTDEWMTRGGQKVEKSPFAQAEKHARHLYHQLFDVIPDGDPKYIIPVVCFVDRATIDDQRSASMQYYLPMAVLNGLKQLLVDRDSPVGEYTLDHQAIEKKLNQIERGKSDGEERN